MNWRKNHACKWIFHKFPGIKHMSAFRQNCQKSICMHVCSPILGKGLFSSKSMGQICPLDLKFLKIFPHGLQNNNAYKWISENFPGITHMLAFLENCQKSICMHGCSPIHKERSLPLFEFHVVPI